MDALSRTMIESVVALPTMSFHETAVSTFIKWYAASVGLGIKEDRAGNILVTHRGGGRGGMTLAAHMDHPGFEVITAAGKRATVALWGKVKPKLFAGSKVRVNTAEGAVKGKIAKTILKKKYLGRQTFTLGAQGEIKKGDFGAFDLPALRIAGDTIRAIACDNLISVAAILDLLTRFVKGRAGVNVAGLFTRGEEAGFLGAFAAMESGLIPKRDPLVVLECSSARGGGVYIGEGPVVRVGDLASTYDPEVEIWLSDVASSLLPGPGSRVPGPGFKYQRALLQGGRCEACVYVAAGYRVGALAMPLGNYHNHGPRGYAAEYVSAADYDNYIKLLTALARRPIGKARMRERVAPIKKHYQGLKRKLISSKGSHLLPLDGRVRERVITDRPPSP